MEIHKKLFARSNPVQKSSDTVSGNLPKAEISVAAIKSLRDKTGLSLGDCKNALVEANGDEAKAIAILQLNSPQTQMIVGMMQQMYPNADLDAVYANGEVLFIDKKTQKVVAGVENGNINLYPN